MLEYLVCSNSLLHKLLKIIKYCFDGAASKHDHEVKYQKQTFRMFVEAVGE